MVKPLDGERQPLEHEAEMKQRANKEDTPYAIFSRATPISKLGAFTAPRLHKEIEMKRSVFVLAGAAAIVAGSILAAQQQPGAKPPAAPMGFFVTSTPIGDGANLGGLQGADAH